ncbi:MAG: hypothetical protein K8823_785 [Cenarchaeum symbiont of Oopsacas minuta]|nr:hypothetical protein [Cenarchaeum symbiont of Oopsacas minuta]
MNNEKIDHICPRSENLEKELALSRKENKQQGETIRECKETMQQQGEKIQQQGKAIRECKETMQQQGEKIQQQGKAIQEYQETTQQTKNENEELKITINALTAKNIRAKPNKPDSVIKLNMQEPAENDQFTLITKPRWIKNHVMSAETNYPKLCINTHV